MTVSSVIPTSDDIRSRIERNLGRATPQRIRALFGQINPDLSEDDFYGRWGGMSKDAAVLIPVIARAEPTILMTIRSSDMPSHAGQISFPGGRVHKEDGSRVETALREAEEEVGIPRESVDVVGALGVHKGGLGFSVTPVIGLVPPDIHFKPCPREVDEMFEVPLSFVANVDNFGVEQREHDGLRYNLFAAPYGRFHIWGLTAGILRTFAETLQDA